MSSATKFQFYHYDPSFVAAVIFIALFALISIRHLILLIRNKTWCFFPFIIGCFFETVGYLGRAISAKESPNWTLKPYIVQSLLTLLGPTLYAASIYMVLGRLIRLLDADAYSMIRTPWLTKVFVLGDVLSFLGQGGGGGILATAKSESSQNLGNTIIIGGLAIQVIFFGFFIVVAAVFHIRIWKIPTAKSRTVAAPWQTFIWVLYFTSLLIMVRSVFRMAEYAMGSDGFLMKKEIYVYVLDALLMFVVAAMFSVFHPSQIMAIYKNIDNQGDVASRLENYPIVQGAGYGGRP